MMNQRTGWDIVHVIYDYCDQPRSGVADYHGLPHWFENIFDKEQDDYSTYYWLTPLSAEEFAAVKQQAEIFSRWRYAFDQGEVDISSHPALPEDIEVYKALKSRIETAIRSKASQRSRILGQFSPLESTSEGSAASAFQVHWSTPK